MATKSAVKKTRVTKAQVAEHRSKSGRDMSPKWDGADTWTEEQFNRHFRMAMEYYRLEKTPKELKPKVLEWMKAQEFSIEDIKAFKRTKDSRCSGTMGGIAACLLRGMPEIHGEFNNGKDTAAWLRDQIHKVVKEGSDDIDEDEIKAQPKVEVYVPSIQERLRDAAGQMAEELDYAVDNWIADSENFDPKAFKVTSLLRTKGTKAAHARIIRTFYERNLAELQELASGDADEQLREGYSSYSRKNVKKLIEFFESIMTACDQIAAEAKLNKKPRAKKVKPVEDLVKKVKFKATDDRYGITSIPATQIVGAQQVVVFNTKTRKLGIYTSKTSEGLAVKGTSIINFTDKSVQKTLRKPELQLKEFKDLNTARRAQTWLDNIKAVGTVMNGRINAEIMILKAWK